MQIVDQILISYLTINFTKNLSLKDLNSIYISYSLIEFTAQETMYLLAIGFHGLRVINSVYMFRGISLLNLGLVKG